MSTKLSLRADILPCGFVCLGFVARCGRPVIERFAQHDCRCPIKRKRGKVVEGTGFARRRRGACEFIDFLQRRDAIPPVAQNRHS